jgi:integrase
MLPRWEKAVTMAKIVLNDRFVQSRKPARAGDRERKDLRDDYRDAVVPGLALRVTDRGHKSFVLVARYPSNPKNPTRRLLGACYLPPKRNNGNDAPIPPRELRHGTLTLAEARDKARAWLDLIGRGIDPKIEAEREKASARRQQMNTFGAVAREFLDRHAATLKKTKEAHRVVEQEFIKRWDVRPITDIRAEEVAAAIRAIVRRGAPAQARNALGWIRSLFNWSIGNPEFGIEVSPIERLKPKPLVGEKKKRDRVLRDEELRAIWDAAEGMGYPYGPCIRLLILTGQRENEVAGMGWSEVDLAKRLWTIPAWRMKGKREQTRAHEVPLAPSAIEILANLPRFAGNCVFSTTSGEKPINGFGKAKIRIDKLSGVTDWVFHDLRRTMRTHLSALPVQDLVRELVIAHAKPGLHQVYDLHAYQDEKRECLELWQRRLLSIVAPPEGKNVLPLRAAG